MGTNKNFVISDEHDYALMYRDAGGFEWEKIGTFERPGDALIARDKELANEEAWLPTGRHRVVNLATGAIIEWRNEDIDRDDVYGS